MPDREQTIFRSVCVLCNLSFIWYSHLTDCPQLHLAAVFLTGHQDVYNTFICYLFYCRPHAKSMAVSVWSGGRDRLLQTWCFETTEICSLTVVEARSLRRAEPCSMWRLLAGSLPLSLTASGGSWHSMVCGHTSAASAPVVTRPPSQCICVSFSSLSLTRTPVTGLTAHPNPGWSSLEIFNWVTPTKIPFPNRVTFPGLG